MMDINPKLISYYKEHKIESIEYVLSNNSTVIIPTMIVERLNYYKNKGYEIILKTPFITYDDDCGDVVELVDIVTEDCVYISIQAVRMNHVDICNIDKINIII